MPPRGFRRAVERVFRRYGPESGKAGGGEAESRESSGGEASGGEAGSGKSGGGRVAALDSDPLQFPRRFGRREDREVAAFLAASLAYGNAVAVRGSLRRVFAWTGPRPARFVRGLTRSAGLADLGGFRHRWTGADDLVRLGLILRRLLEEHGTLEAAFSRGIARGRGGRADLGASIERFRAEALRFEPPDFGSTGFGSPDPDPTGRDPTGSTPGRSRPGVRYFFPNPRTSAAKRTAMFLRWVVREDDGLDLGLWNCLEPRDLVVPLDTHMFRIARRLGFTRRQTPGWQAALDLTRGLARLDPQDPTKYDFALSRLGIVEGCPRHPRTAPCELCRLLR